MRTEFVVEAEREQIKKEEEYDEWLSNMKKKLYDDLYDELDATIYNELSNKDIKAVEFDDIIVEVLKDLSETY